MNSCVKRLREYPYQIICVTNFAPTLFGVLVRDQEVVAVLAVVGLDALVEVGQREAQHAARA